MESSLLGNLPTSRREDIREEDPLPTPTQTPRPEVPQSDRSQEALRNRSRNRLNDVENIRNRIENIMQVLNNRSPFEFTFVTNASDIETNVIISHRTIMNNTTLEVFNGNQNTENQNTDTENTDTENTENQNSDNQEETPNMCVICRENIDNNSIVRRINKCNHFFHVGCIDTWFQDNITCPHCRQDIREEDV